MSDENINLLDQEEWRMVHNALTHWGLTHPTQAQRVKLYALADKVRDSYISYENPEDQQEISK